MTARNVLAELKKCQREDKALFFPGFFQAYPGGYGEGDCFLGVVVPDQRRIAKMYRTLPREDIAKLLASKWHECRLSGLFILTDQFERSFSGRDANHELARENYDFYLENLDAVNNWDLVDATAPKISGPFAVANPSELKTLRKLVKSKGLWEQRVAVLSTFAFIRNDQFDLTIEFANRLLDHEHDLIHKAVGWMLREVWKRDPQCIVGFLEANSKQMPRTMLRYTIEKMPRDERLIWMGR